MPTSDRVPANYQTVRLAKGRHSSPQGGVCVMELVSMLAGEPFTDRPTTACPVIASFMRGYNDRVDDQRRQDLRRCDADLVGSYAGHDVMRARHERLIEWGSERLAGRRFAALRGWLGRTPKLDSMRGRDAAGVFAARTIGRVTDDVHDEVLRLVDELVAMGRPSPGVSRARPDERSRVPVG